MPQRRAAYPSALKTGTTHFALSTAVFTGLTVAGASVLQLTGNGHDAGPVITVALFDAVEHSDAPQLKTRLRDHSIPDIQLAAMTPVQTRPELEEPSLGVEYERVAEPVRIVEAPKPIMRMVEEGSAQETLGVRINGRTVLPGEAFSAVRSLDGLVPAPIEGLQEATRFGAVPAIAADGRAPVDAYARPFENRDGLPTVSIVLGGLGLNYTHTKNAINELPPEVTLSFSPHARGLKSWIKRAREAGHEVLVELPLEPLDHGRVKPHALTVSADLSRDAASARVDQFLATGTGYFGVANYQGDKLAQNTALSDAVLKKLTERGLAFVEDGSLPKDGFRAAAVRTGVHYVRSNLVLDTRIDANEMQTQFMALEAQAKQTGAALGTAIAYPVTIDALRDWTASLPSRGLILAPTSHLVQRVRPTVARVEADPVPVEIVTAKPFKLAPGP